MSGSDCLCEKLAPAGMRLDPKCFGQVWLFAGAPPEAWGAVAGELVRRVLKPGEDLFRQGDEADGMFILKAGAVKLWKTSEEGRALTLDIRRAGDVLGENSLTEGGFYPVTATALETTLACGIDKPTFERLVKSFPDVGLAVIRNLSQRIDHLSGKLDALSEPQLDERLHRILSSVARETGKKGEGGWTISFPLTHEEIGFLVGAHRVSITRALGKLRDSGKIRNEKGLLFVAE